MKAARKLQKLQHPQTLIQLLREFLTPQVWKQARQAVPRRRCPPRWDLQPVVLVLLAMIWSAGDSEFERFESARGFYVMSHDGRRRPGGAGRGHPLLKTRLELARSERANSP